jgi:hypothetical protein
MACNHDICESENSREQKFLFSFYLWNIIYDTHLILYHPLSLLIYPLTTHHSNDKYRKMMLDSLSRTSCTHGLLPSGNVAHNVTRHIIYVASHSEDKSRHTTNRVSVARAATSMTLSTLRRDVVWNIDPGCRERRWVWRRT